MAPGKAAELAGQPAVPSTTSLDLPSGLAKILAMDTFNPASPIAQPAGLATSVSPAAMAQNEVNPMVPQFRGGGMVGYGGRRVLPHYQDGGAVGPGGVPLAPTGAPPGQLGPKEDPSQQTAAMQQWQSQPMDPSQMHSTIDEQLAQNPQAANQIQGEIIKALQSGDLTTQELNTAVQLIEAAVNNPQLYPQLRQFAVQQGIAGEEDLPQQYDKGFVMLLLTVAKSAQQLIQGGASAPGMGGGAGAAPMGGAPMQSMMNGGNVEGKRDAPVPIMAHEGEYVVPKHVVGMKGREFFDKLVEKYNGQQK